MCATSRYGRRPVQNNFMRGFFLIAALVSTAILAGCHSTPPPKPLDQLTEQEARGHAVYQAHCAVCHYDRVSKPLHGPPLRGVFKKQYLPSGAPANDDRVSATVLHGRSLMPAQPQMDPQDLDNLLAYLHTL
jgi:mono/diheme cytochrome c family protein